MYGEALDRMKEEMGLKKVPEEKRRWIALYFGEMGNLLRHLPFGGFQKKGHEFGCLRLWLKYKNFKNKDRTWDTLGWRPLVSYRRHRYRRLFSLVSRL